jgi:hypothetical protein
MRFLVIAAALVQLVGCASSQPSLTRTSHCDSLDSKISELLNSSTDIRAVPNHEQIAVYLHEERLKVDMKAALDKCIAAYDFDFKKAPIVDAASVPKSLLEGAQPPLDIGFQRLRQQLDSQLEKAFIDFQSAWMGLLTTAMQANRSKYKFKFVDGCEAEAESMSRSIISNIARDSSNIGESPVYLLYSKCVAK